METQKTETGRHERAVIAAIAAVVLVVIVGVLLARFVMNSVTVEKNSREYNGFEFTRNGNFWTTEWERSGQAYSLEFRHPPWEVENITVDGKVDERFQRTFYFLTHDPVDESSRQTAFVALAASDIATMLKLVFERQGVAACTKNLTSACSDRPLATCSTNASVIYLRISNQTGIFLDGNCAVFQGTEENLTRASDKALYQWLGIMR